MLINMRNAMFGGKSLPYDAEVEYLEFTGTQWLDTGIAPTDKTGVECSIFWTTTNYNMNPFGVIEDLPGGRTRFMMQINTRYLPNVYFGTSLAITQGGAGAGVWNDISLAQGKYVNNGINVGTVSYSPFSFTHRLACGGYNTAANMDQVVNCFVGRMRYFRLTNDGVLVLDYIPVRFTNELGVSEGAMYDRANPKVGMNPDGSARTDGLYRNRGTGAFIIGPDI